MYSYEKERPELFTEAGQKQFLAIRDTARELIKTAGAFSMEAAISGQCGSNWFHMACVDRLVELGELVECSSPHAWAQHRIFTSARK